jgi:hypothetical protein
MDDELATIASAGAASLGTAVAADAWRGIRTGIAMAFRRVFRYRRAADARAAAGEPSPEVGAGTPPEPVPARYEQVNIAHDGNVLAVQHGNMRVHLPTRNDAA